MSLMSHPARHESPSAPARCDVDGCQETDVVHHIEPGTAELVRTRCREHAQEGIGRALWDQITYW